MAKPNNPPAFPTDPRSLAHKPGDGMTLRDYFAIRASEEDIEHYRVKEFEYHSQSKTTSVKYLFTREQARFRFADAMLVEREKEV